MVMRIGLRIHSRVMMHCIMNEPLRSMAEIDFSDVNQAERMTARENRKRETERETERKIRLFYVV